MFGVGAYFKKEHVRAERPSKIYVRDGQEGRKLRVHFCPTCGTIVLWEADLRPDHIGVAVDAFMTPTSYGSTRSSGICAGGAQQWRPYREHRSVG